MKTWGLDVAKGAVVVDPLMHTNLDRVWACGDITTFDGKLKLIATVFASDALSSVSYATEETLLVLVAAGTTHAVLHVSWPIALAIAAVLTVVVASYRQTVRAY